MGTAVRNGGLKGKRREQGGDGGGCCQQNHPFVPYPLLRMSGVLCRQLYSAPMSHIKKQTLFLIGAIDYLIVAA